MKLRNSSPKSPEFEQKNTQGLRSYDLPGFELLDPPGKSSQPASEQQISGIHRAVQQIIFLPLFETTDHIFYGDTIDSRQAHEGYGSVRIAMIDGVNFRLHLEQNFNYGDCLLRLNMKRSETRVYFESDEPEVDAQTAVWLSDSVLTPVRDELMIRSSRGELEDDF